MSEKATELKPQTPGVDPERAPAQIQMEYQTQCAILGDLTYRAHAFETELDKINYEASKVKNKLAALNKEAQKIATKAQLAELEKSAPTQTEVINEPETDPAA